MWLLKADEKTVTQCGLSHYEGNTYVGGMNLPDSEGQWLIIVTFIKTI